MLLATGSRVFSFCNAFMSLLHSQFVWVVMVNVLCVYVIGNVVR